MSELAFLLAAVLLIDQILGDPASSWHPVAVFGRLARHVEALCRRVFGSGIGSGLIGWSALTIVPAGLTLWAVGRLETWSGVAAGIATALIGYVAVALRSLTDHAGRIRRPLAAGDLDQARGALAMIVSRDTAKLPESDIVRGAIESVGENIVDAVTSALFWMTAGFLIGGLPGAAAGAVLLRCGNTLDACWGYKNPRYLYFGRVAARADDALHYLPARLTLLAIAAAAPLVGGGAVATLRTGFRHRHDHPSPNSGWGMAGFAGALGLRLGGPTVYDGELEDYPYWGDGRAELTPADLRRAERLARGTAVIFVLLLLAIAGGIELWRK